MAVKGKTGRAYVLYPFPRVGAAKDHDVAVRSPQAGLEEAIGLTAAIDLDIVGADLVRLVNPRPSTLFGKGTVEALAERIAELEITVCVVDAPVTPVQQRIL